MLPTSCRVTFVGMDAAEGAAAEVRGWIPRLGIIMDSASAVHVLIESVEERRKQRLYRVRMELTMPDGVMAVSHDHPSNTAHEDVFVAIRNAFRAARRQLESYVAAPSLNAPVIGDLSPSTTGG
jgi:hypothetical protein